MIILLYLFILKSWLNKDIYCYKSKCLLLLVESVIESGQWIIETNGKDVAGASTCKKVANQRLKKRDIELEAQVYS